jgi:hypothetical protein
VLGFQFIVTLTRKFADLAADIQVIHFAALAAIMAAVVLLIAPAAVHRLSFNGEDSEVFHEVASRLITAALVPLALGITADFYVAAHIIFNDRTMAVGAATAVLALLAALWYGLPLSLRHRSRFMETNS